MKIATTDTDFNLLEHATDKRGVFVRVPKSALAHLLADHITLLAAAKSKGHRIDAGADQESLR